jgi:hypothetical protein
MGAMERRRHYVGPLPWPPDRGVYDYTLTLCLSDLAWEYLRRQPLYQHAYQLSRAGIAQPRRLRSGLRLTRVRKCALRAESWCLHSFR